VGGRIFWFTSFARDTGSADRHSAKHLPKLPPRRLDGMALRVVPEKIAACYLAPLLKGHGDFFDHEKSETSTIRRQIKGIRGIHEQKVNRNNSLGI
jgi:hypothetical protein